MKFKFYVLTIILALIFLGFLFGFWFYFSTKNFVVKKEPEINNLKKIELSQVELEKIKIEFPEVVIGIITLSDQASKIKTLDNKEYLLWPPQPVSIYQYLGIKSGQKVEIQGKILEENRLQWRLIK